MSCDNCHGVDVSSCSAHRGVAPEIGSRIRSLRTARVLEVTSHGPENTFRAGDGTFETPHEGWTWERVREDEG